MRQKAAESDISAGARARAAYTEIREWLAETPESVNCQVVIERLRSTDRPAPLPKLQMRVERAMMWDGLQRADEPDIGRMCNSQRELDIAVEELERYYARWWLYHTVDGSPG